MGSATMATTFKTVKAERTEHFGFRALVLGLFPGSLQCC